MRILLGMVERFTIRRERVVQGLPETFHVMLPIQTGTVEFDLSLEVAEQLLNALRKS